MNTHTFLRMRQRTNLSDEIMEKSLFLKTILTLLFLFITGSAKAELKFLREIQEKVVFGDKTINEDKPTLIHYCFSVRPSLPIHKNKLIDDWMNEGLAKKYGWNTAESNNKRTEEELSEEKWAEKLLDTKFVAGLIRRHLNNIRNKALVDLISSGVEGAYKSHSESLWEG